MRMSARDYGDARRRPQARPRRVWLRRLLQATLVAAALPVLTVLALRWVDPPTSAFMLAYRVEQGAWPRFQWQPMEAISPQLAIAVVAAEDQRFPQHAGFDMDAIRSALDEARDGGRRRGASTLSQQVAKNLFLWETSSWPRKGLEAGLTVLIEALWPKRRILEMHLNLAEFGPGVYGAEAAAQHWYGKSAAALAAADAARLALVLPAPRRYSPVRPSPALQRRAAWVQQQVRQLGGPAYLRDCCGLQ
jgi:monofunctional biosynthetic peptidoglycan transglycosylase